MVKMLIVEDNQLFRSTLRESLSHRFPALELDEAETLAGALLKLQECPPNLALLDIQLPDGSGLDLATRILAGWPGIPVGICTSHDLPEYREAADRIGVTTFLLKQHLDWDAFGAFIHAPPTAPNESLRSGREQPAQVTLPKQTWNLSEFD